MNDLTPRERLAAHMQALLSDSLHAYVHRAFLELYPGIAFMPAHYIRAICYQLERVERGEVRRLLIILPPRHLKSHCASVAFSTWFLARNPSKTVVGASYNAGLAQSFSAQARRLLEAPWHRVAFPHLRLDPRKASVEELRIQHFGGRRIATSVGGTFTGKGSSVTIIDDPIKADDAFSEARREDVNKWMHSTVIMVRGVEQAKERRARLERDVEAHLRKLSWWNRLNFDEPDFRAMDREIEKLERQVKGFLRANASEIEAAETRIQILHERAEERLAGAERAALTAVPEDRNAKFDSNPIAMNALVMAALSVPVSAWSDLASAGEVYDALRSVNGNYASLTDAEIWLQTFLLEPEQLAGLLSLTKGALFEAYVADSTGGVLHEHFNTPETDIVIDGTEYQIKATDSAAYISTVDEGIPVIATSEVAETTEAFDGGITDAELERVSELALGGSVIDLNDTAIDAVVSGFGGLYSRENFKLNRAAALAEWRELGAG